MLADGADVNARNDSGQTPLILAIITGQYQVVELLLATRADPFRQDNTGLNAIQWAQRKGRPDLAELLSKSSHWATREETPRLDTEERTPRPSEPQPQRAPLSAEERSRRFIAGLKQRLDEKAVREVSSPLPPSTEEAPARRTDAETAEHRDAVIEPPKVPVTIGKAPASEDHFNTPSLREEESKHRSSSRKRCPKCGTVYDSELLAYCAYDEVPLVDADTPIVTPRPQADSGPMFWGLVLIALAVGALAGLFIINRLFDTSRNPNPSVAAPQPQPSQKGKPQLSEELAGKADLLPDAEVPANTTKEPATIIVRVRVDRGGRVYSASSTSGDQVLRQAAIEAATKAAFSVKKLKGRGAEGTINYTFK
jgi:TonB family protein